MRYQLVKWNRTAWNIWDNQRKRFVFTRGSSKANMQFHLERLCKQ